MARRGQQLGGGDSGGDRAVYIISVAAELAGVHPQTLRIYERKGLLTPARTRGNTRRYSNRDIDRLRSIQRLTQEFGINLAGVKMIVEMENELDRMRAQLDRLGGELERARRRMRDAERVRAEQRNEMVPLSSIRRLRLRFPVERPQPDRGPIAVGPGEPSPADERSSGATRPGIRTEQTNREERSRWT
jgi:MerR family transcriptional regulator, heat shock protein HspR